MNFITDVIKKLIFSITLGSKMRLIYGILNVFQIISDNEVSVEKYVTFLTFFISQNDFNKI